MAMVIGAAGSAWFLTALMAPPASGARRTEMVCEQWRDYLFNAETGSFIEWVSDPYWVCHTTDEQVS